MICTFFGHRNTPEAVRSSLHHTIQDLIENYGVDTFYVGNQGGFDLMVKQELKKAADTYPNIRYTIVLAYLPEAKNLCVSDEESDTLYPDGLENVPRRFAIDRRNHMMIEWSDFVVVYVSSPFGGAAKFKEIAEKKGKRIINLSPL